MSLAVQGPRPVLSPGWQEANSQHVRPLRYPPRGGEGAGQSPGKELGGSCRASLGTHPTCWEARLWASLGWFSLVPPSSTLVPRQQEKLAWLGTRAAAGHSGPVLSLI